MAKKSSSDDFKNIMSSLETGDRKPVYLLMGEESKLGHRNDLTVLLRAI